MTAEVEQQSCRICHALKPLDAFHRNRRRANGRTIYCRACILARGRALGSEPWGVKLKRAGEARRAQIDPASPRRCSRCSVVKTRRDFYAVKGKPAVWCKDCANAHTRARYQAKRVPVRLPQPINANGELQCSRCKAYQSPSSYYKPSSYVCIPCTRARKREREALYGLAKRRYGADPTKARMRAIERHHINPTGWAGQGGGRARQIAATCDGSLNKSTITALFSAAKVCPYCDQPMRSSGKQGKTLDHKQPLKLGGAHTLANSLICCLPCNSTKGARSWEDWVTYMAARRAILSQARVDTRCSAEGAPGTRASEKGTPEPCPAPRVVRGSAVG